MDEPGSRTAPSELIIEDPELQTTGQKVLYATLTVVFWAVWIYLWLPLITLAGWAFGVQRFVDVMLVQDGWVTLRDVLAFYLITIAIMGGTLIVWATYNRVRFTGRERRVSTVAEPSSVRLAKTLGAPESTVRGWQTEKCLCVTHDAQGRIGTIETMREARQTFASEIEAGSPADIASSEHYVVNGAPRA
ncbi:MAG TPA: poly-beta-1,6-N-acetyl-D-glucosamine biosynthesis protein PgaD [Burkholderiales bacterium]|nr:poly-beta-1,6-N-acetyl-D-glucosamine biosynthesis protein PgaD [Burkholderiales bacterium]